MSGPPRIHLGIDEAGRGSVIGPLVLGAVSIDESTLEYYNQTEINDSKQLSAEKRTELFSLIQHNSHTYSTILLQPAEIDKAVSSYTNNLNLLELQTMVKLIINNPDSTDIFIDAISKPRYCTTNLRLLLKKYSDVQSIKEIDNETLRFSRLSGKNKSHATIISQNKADATFKVVGAASIIAKTIRDLEIRKIEEEYSFPKDILASGYPNEQLKPFLQKYQKQIKNKEFPFIRYTWDWQPLKSIISKDKMKQTKLF